MAAAWPGPGICEPAGPEARNRYADLLRVLAIGLVVLGHWRLTSISYRRGLLYSTSALAVIGWSGWWALRVAWIAALAVVLVPTAVFLARFERPMRRRPGPAPARAPAAPGRSWLAAAV